MHDVDRTRPYRLLRPEEPATPPLRSPGRSRVASTSARTARHAVYDRSGLVLLPGRWDHRRWLEVMSRSATRRLPGARQTPHGHWVSTPCSSGLISFIGWAADLPRLTDWIGDGISIQPNATIAAMCSGAAILLLRARPSSHCRAVRRMHLGDRWQRVVSVRFRRGPAHRHAVDVRRGMGTTRRVVPGRMGPPGAISWTIIGFACIIASLFPTAVDASGIARPDDGVADRGDLLPVSDRLPVRGPTSCTRFPQQLSSRCRHRPSSWRCRSA